MYDIEGTVFTVSALTAAYSKQLREAREAELPTEDKAVRGEGECQAKNMNMRCGNWPNTFTSVIWGLIDFL